MSNFDFFGKTVALILGLVSCGLIFGACSQSDTPEVVNPDNKWIKVDGMQVHEIHPRPGVTCFVVYNNGISCIHD